jgi:hypothetical protein
MHGDFISDAVLDAMRPECSHRSYSPPTSRAACSS